MSFETKELHLSTNKLSYWILNQIPKTFGIFTSGRLAEIAAELSAIQKVLIGIVGAAVLYNVVMINIMMTSPPVIK